MKKKTISVKAHCFQMKVKSVLKYNLLISHCQRTLFWESCFEGEHMQPLFCKFEIMPLSASILMFNNVMCSTPHGLFVFSRAPLCYPLLTMWSVCAVVLALAAAALGSAESETHRPRHDSNLEICILLQSVCRAAANTQAWLWGCQCVCLCVHVLICSGIHFYDIQCDRWLHEWAFMWVTPTWKVCVVLTSLLSDKRLFETKRKDQLNALKNLVELNDINQQYKIIDIMLKGLFKVGCVRVCSHILYSHSLWAAAK